MLPFLMNNSLVGLVQLAPVGRLDREECSQHKLPFQIIKKNKKTSTSYSSFEFRKNRPTSITTSNHSLFFPHCSNETNE